MFYLRYLYLLAYSGFKHILCCVFVLFVFVVCTLCYQFLWICPLLLPLQYSQTFMLEPCIQTTILFSFHTVIYNIIECNVWCKTVIWKLSYYIRKYVNRNTWQKQYTSLSFVVRIATLCNPVLYYSYIHYENKLSNKRSSNWKDGTAVDLLN